VQPFVARSRFMIGSLAAIVPGSTRHCAGGRDCRVAGAAVGLGVNDDVLHVRLVVADVVF
jgi:hypothetical protein